MNDFEPMADVKTYYDTYWTEEGFNPLGETASWQRELFDRELPAGSRCLDLGCGDGGTSGVHLVSNGYEYVGADISETAVATAKEKGLEAIRISDAGELPFEGNSFDAVVCFEVIEHLFDVEAALTEIKRVLKPGGVVILSTPNIVYWRRRLDLLFGRWNPMGDSLAVEQPWRDPHIRFFTTKTLDACLKKCGFNHSRVTAVMGAFLKDLPSIGRIFPKRSSFLYRAIERLYPSLFGYRLVAVARNADQ